MINPQSLAMKFFRGLGMNSIAWSLRRLHCPVKNDDLVLEVGSGGNPYFRANVLLDAYEETRERNYEPLVTDRQTVLGFVEHLPFKDKAFDFVIASHVLEHSINPERFLGELQRVAKAGYIEVPDAFLERINPYPDHRLEITLRDDKLLINKKSGFLVDPHLVDLYEHKAKPLITSDTYPKYPFEFHVRYYWSDSIHFEIVNPDVDASWPDPLSHKLNNPTTAPDKGLRAAAQTQVLNLVRATMSQRQRNAKIQINDLLACPNCGSSNLITSSDTLSCNACNTEYPVRNGIPVMYKQT
jgi:SAM-dependent methyltransferase